MLKETLIQIYEADITKVIGEIEKYENEEDVWKLAEGITNSGGNLALHLIGNIKHFFGANLGNTGYVRERDSEFADKDVSRKQIITGLEEASQVLRDALKGLSDEQFEAEYPEEIFGGGHKTSSIAIYMLSHLNYHLGQINYHRRLLSR